jgi:hypothetical protein
MCKKRSLKYRILSKPFEIILQCIYLNIFSVLIKIIKTGLWGVGNGVEDIKKGCRRVNMVEILCTHV